MKSGRALGAAAAFFVAGSHAAIYFSRMEPAPVIDLVTLAGLP